MIDLSKAAPTIRLTTEQQYPWRLKYQSPPAAERLRIENERIKRELKESRNGE
jgi:hypothetical protein